jgi:hypothetical protein
LGEMSTMALVLGVISDGSTDRSGVRSSGRHGANTAYVRTSVVSCVVCRVSCVVRRASCVVRRASCVVCRVCVACVARDFEGRIVRTLEVTRVGLELQKYGQDGVGQHVVHRVGVPLERDRRGRRVLDRHRVVNLHTTHDDTHNASVCLAETNPNQHQCAAP